MTVIALSLTKSEETTNKSIESLFDSKCAYMELNKISKDLQCHKLQFNNQSIIEGLFEISTITTSKTFITPFIIDLITETTTLTKEAKDIIGFNENNSILILGNRIDTKIGSQNILGLDFIRKTKLGIDFRKQVIGMYIKLSDDSNYTINWPPATFTEIMNDETVESLEAEYIKLKESIPELKNNTNNIIDRMKKKLSERRKYMKKLRTKRENRKKHIDL